MVEHYHYMWWSCFQLQVTSFLINLYVVKYIDCLQELMICYKTVNFYIDEIDQALIHQIIFALITSKHTIIVTFFLT